MKKKLLYIMFSLVCFWIIPIRALELELYSKNALLYNLDENKVLYEKNAREPIAIASLTKIMTAIVAIENIESLDEKVILTSKDFEGLVEANASVAGFSFGQIVTYRDLLHGLLLPSGADAAQALTRNIAGNKENFVKMMNEKAKELGLVNTHFSNATGLDEKNHYSTLEDVAVIFQYALQNGELAKILQSKNYTMSDGSFTVSSTIFKNIKRYNLALNYILGGKTGTTNDAGLCLASIAYENGTNYMLITAGAPYPAKEPYHFYDTKTIYDYFIEHFENKSIVDKGETVLSLKTRYAKEDVINFFAEKSVQKYMPKEFSKDDLTYYYNGTDIISPNIKVGTNLGILEIRYSGKVLAQIDIVLVNQPHFDILKYLEAHIVIVIFVVCVSIIITIIFWKNRKRNRGLQKYFGK